MTKHLSVQAGDGKLRGSHRLLVMLGPVTSALLATMTQPATAGPVEDAFAGIARTPPEAVMGVSIAEVCLSGRAGEPLQRDCDALAGAALSPDAGTRSQASNALGQVTPDQANGAVDESRTSVAAQLRNIGQRLAALRGGATGISAQGLTMEDGDLMYGRHYAGIASAGGAASADEAGLGRLGMFVDRKSVV